MREAPDDLTLLICRHLDGLTTADESATLADRLRSSGESRAMLIALALQARRLSEPLRERVQGNSKFETRNSNFRLRRTAAARSPSGSSFEFRISSLSIAAAMALLITGWFIFKSEPRTLNPEPSRAAHAVAMLADGSSGRWADHSSVGAMTPAGGAIEPGRLALVSGTSEVVLASGVMVTLTGPCEFDLIDPSQGRLLRGRMQAHVPPRAKGFTLMTPGGVRVVDLGTAFNVEVDAAGRTRVWVTEGAVLMERMNPRDGRIDETMHLTAGQAAIARVGSEGTRLIAMRPVEVVNASFELNQAGEAIGEAEAFVGTGNLAGWEALPPGGNGSLALSQTRRSDAVDDITDNFPAGGAEGDRVAQINAYPNSGAASLAQELEAVFEPGGAYQLTVAVGRRLDHDRLNLPGAAWRISVHQADTGSIAGGGTALLEGTLEPGEGGRLTDRTLRFTPSADDLGRRIQIRLTNTTTGRDFNAVNFDAVRLNHEPNPDATELER